MNNKQTAVEWLSQQILDNWNDIHHGARNIEEFIIQAKAIENEQIKHAYYVDRLTADVEVGLDPEFEFTEYYTQVYGGETMTAGENNNPGNINTTPNMYRKKPVTIEALQWTGNNHRQMFNFLGGEDTDYMTASGTNFYIDWSKVEGGLVIKTLEGEHIASIGDWIIKGVKGEFYPYKPDVFEMTYEKV